MKLAFVTETFPPEINGVAMTFGTITRELGRRGHAVTVYRPQRSDLPGDASHPEFREIALPGLPIPGYPLLRLGLPAAGRLKRVWRAERPDLVHVATEGPLGASAITAARALGVPVTSSFHTNFHAYAGHYGCAPLRRLALAWLRRVHNRARLTFVPTRELCTELAALGFRHVTLLSRGVDTRQFSPARRSAKLRIALGIGPDTPIVLHVGRMAAEKNYPLLLRAFAAMRSANSRCRFVLVGDGPLRTSLRRTLPGAIFTGFVSRDELALHYASADLYVHASLTETFGNVLTEAMASGLATASFDYAAARQFVRDGVNGLTVPCAQPEALIAAAARLVAEPGLRARLGPAARATVEPQSWENVIAGFEADLHAVASGGEPAPFGIPSATSPSGNRAPFTDGLATAIEPSRLKIESPPPMTDGIAPIA
ncbi:MAG: glycosyltransferase family 1 protein, partial [Verrucomicrobiota bacterium]